MTTQHNKGFFLTLLLSAVLIHTGVATCGAKEDMVKKKSPLERFAEHIRNPESRNKPIPQDIKDDYIEWRKTQVIESPDSMEPPWVAKPEWKRSNLGWRMGGGEDYMNNYYSWINQLSEEDFIKYAKEFPEPAEWVGTYDSARR